MKIGFLRKIYPYLNENAKNIKWRRLTDIELDKSMADKQVIANCFDEATRYALLASEKGRDLLKKRLFIQSNAETDPAYKIILNVKGKDEIYRATKKDYFGNHFSLYRDFSEDPSGLFNFDSSKSQRLSLGVSIAIRKMIRKHPSMKSLWSRLYMFPGIRNRACEYNKPSNAFRWFTSKPPIAMGEKDLSLNLKKHKDEVITLLEDLGKRSPKEYSFVAVTGSKKVEGLSEWHTLPIVGVNTKTKKVIVLNKRTNNKTKIPFDEFIDKFKAIVGIKH